MDAATALTTLKRFVQWDSKPLLTEPELIDLLRLYRVTDSSGYGFYDPWAATTIYTVSSSRTPVASNGHAYIVTVAGTSGGAEPTWPTTTGATVVDGSVTWQEAGLYLWTPTWSLRAAASEGWRWKAAKVAGNFDVAAGGGTSFRRSQTYQHCMEMARRYGGGMGSIQLRRGVISAGE